MRPSRDLIGAYYTVISGANAVLEEDTIDARRRIYNRARSAQTKQLDQLRPSLTEEAFQAECFALVEAIHKVELESADRQRTNTHSSASSKPLERLVEITVTTVTLGVSIYLIGWALWLW